MIKNPFRGFAATALAFAALAPASPAHADDYTLTEAITSLPVAEEVRDGYRRELYPHRKDDDKNGCSARNDVLTAEAIEAPTVGVGCTLTGGVWHSYYDDVIVQGSSGIDIDHAAAPPVRQRPRMSHACSGSALTASRVVERSD
ncbi:hypothetical protein [Streptomyces sp. NPDC001717]|uniref:hypothetical protein n=1 Tax=Streptomyces sp. NPDC001717 TaxID=3364604 RepID=UPI0036C30426